jgi:putative inorganic carbon (HCO3(-)) transporter
MRSILVTLIVLGTIPFILARPYIGILVWSWIGYMNPHRMTFGFAQTLPFAQIIALVTIVAILFSKEPKRIPMSGLTLLWIMFIVWMILTTQVAFFPAEASYYLGVVLKIQFVTFLTLMLINDRKRIEQLLWVIVLSIGFFSVKGGAFTLLTGGGSRVFGPPGGMIEENNALALATLMIIPLMHYLYSQAKRASVRWLLLGMMILSAVSVFGSQSRGAMVGGAILAFFFWMKSRRKFVTAMALVLLVPAVVAFMPDSWHERISTMTSGGRAHASDIESMLVRSGSGRLSAPIATRDHLGYWPTDFSALGRVNAWNYAINVANGRVTGAGFESWSPDTFARFAPIVEEVQGGHSIYFGVLADHGWPGLILFLTILLVAWRTASKSAKATERIEDLKWIADLMRMIQLSLVGYCVAGAFLSLAYFDLPWHMISLIVICQSLVRQSKSRSVAGSGPVLGAGAGSAGGRGEGVAPNAR